MSDMVPTAVEQRVAIRVWGPPAKMVGVSVVPASDDNEFTPQECRDLAKLLIEAADQAERGD